MKNPTDHLRSGVEMNVGNQRQEIKVGGEREISAQVTKKPLQSGRANINHFLRLLFVCLFVT